MNISDDSETGNLEDRLPYIPLEETPLGPLLNDKVVIGFGIPNNIESPMQHSEDRIDSNAMIKLRETVDRAVLKGYISGMLDERKKKNKFKHVKNFSMTVLAVITGMYLGVKILLKPEMDSREQKMMQTVDQKLKDTISNGELWNDAYEAGVKFLGPKVDEYIKEYGIERYVELYIREVAVPEFKAQFEESYGKPLTENQIKEIFAKVYENNIKPDIGRMLAFGKLLGKNTGD